MPLMSCPGQMGRLANFHVFLKPHALIYLLYIPTFVGRNHFLITYHKTNLMKQTILSLFLSVLFIFGLCAQASLTLAPMEVQADGFIDLSNPDFDLKAYATLKNEGDEPISIIWERKIISAPEDWVVQVCDLNFCYDAIVYSNVAPDLNLNLPITLNPGEQTNMDVYVRPEGVSGFGEVKLEISNADTPDEVLLTGTYTFDALLSSLASRNKPRLAVYPNPATDYIEVQGAEQVSRLLIYNIVGQQMRSFRVTPGSRHYIGGLPTGLYLASLIGGNGEVLKTFRLSKRTVRP